MNKIIILFCTLMIFSLSWREVSAHPGNTASDGCHYCRTNCDKWGVPWNERHCHGGGAPVVETQPSVIYSTSTPVPIRIVLPTNTPIPTATPTEVPIPTSTPTPSIAPTEVENLETTSKVDKEKPREEGFWRKLVRFLFGR